MGDAHQCLAIATTFLWWDGASARRAACCLRAFVGSSEDQLVIFWATTFKVAWVYFPLYLYRLLVLFESFSTARRG